ncbi:MAG: NAD(P)H-hydrate epimerase [Candidatus Omnitrophota bacterium]
MSEIILTAQQAKEIDKKAKEDWGIEPLVLMENAGAGIAQAALGFVNKNKLSRIAILCGKGNNAGDGFVAARHLLASRQLVDIYTFVGQEQSKNEAQVNFDILKKATDQIFEIKDEAGLKSLRLKDYGLVIDALLGIGLKGEVRGILKEVISLVNKAKIPVIAVDIPSGLDATTGEIHGIAIRALMTITFMAKKQGLLIGEGPEYCGNIIVKDLGLPIKIYDSP